MILTRGWINVTSPVLAISSICLYSSGTAAKRREMSERKDSGIPSARPCAWSSAVQCASG